MKKRTIYLFTILFSCLASLCADPKKIVLVTPYSWSVPGGVNVHVEGLAEALINQGHQVTILAPADGPTPDGVISIGQTKAIQYNGSVARVAFGPMVAIRIHEELNRLIPDIIHIHEPFSPGASLYTLLKVKVPTVGTFHMGSSSCLLYSIFFPALQPLWEKLDARIAVSPISKSTIQRSFNGEIHTIPNGINTKRFDAVKSPPAIPTIAFIGRLEERKGARVLLEAFPLIAAQIPNARLLIAGNGPERDALEKMVPDSLKTQVQFLGRIDDVADLASQSSVFCMPSLHGESFGIVLLEAMAAGRPIVASNIPGYRSVLGEGIGLYAEPGNSHELANELVRVLKNESLRTQMSLAGKKEVMKFDWATLVLEIETIYDSAISSHSKNALPVKRL